MRPMKGMASMVFLVAAGALCGFFLLADPGGTAEPQARGEQTPTSPERKLEQRMQSIERYFAAMEEDVSVYDPATPWLFDGKAAWRRRVPHLNWELLDLNSFHRTEVELGDMRITTFYRELRRVEGSFVSRLHGRITFVHLKQPDGSWWLWHDHTAENAEDYSYQQ